MPSENGWEPAHATPDLLEWITVPGSNGVTLQLLKGQPLTIMRAYAADYNAFVEPLRDADSAAFTPTNSVATSNHLNGTAMDLNWDSHPFHVSYGGYSPQMIDTTREILAFYEDTMFWGQDWGGNPFDCMHHQMGYDTYGAQNVARVQDFIARKIRADGFSTFRRGGAPVPPPPPPGGNAVDVLVRATGITVAKATEILPTVLNGLRLSQCDNVNRIAMWLAQMGHESASFVYTEEIQSGDESTDRWLYKGRTWIQITWRTNYAQFSQWLFDKGLILSPTYFVDHPKELAQQQWAGIGPAWYWTVARPQINSLCDKRDLFDVTQAINGGQNGAPDRKRRYDMALALGDQLLALVGGTPPPPPPQPQPPGEDDWLNMPSNQEKLDAIYNALFTPRPPENIYREASETVGQNLVDSIRSTLSMTYEGVVERLALLGESSSIDKVVRVARGQGPDQRPWAVQRAQLIWQKGLAGSAVTAARVMPAPAEPVTPTETLPAVRVPLQRDVENNLYVATGTSPGNTPQDLLDTLDRLKQFDSSYREKFTDLTKESKK